jgi:integrase
MKLRATPAKRRFNIVEFRNPSGAMAWRVSGIAENGERVRANFRTKAEAEGERDRLESEFRNTSIATRLVSTRLNDDQVAAAERAIAMLPDGKSLAEAVRYYLDNYREPVIKKSLDDAFVEFLADKAKANKREDTIRSLKTKVGFMVTRHGRMNVGDLGVDLVRETIDRPGTGPVTRNGVRRALSSFFSWAKVKSYCAANPCEAIDPVEVDHEDPVILPLGDVCKLMDAAASYKDGAVLPYTAIALFAGVRPTELSKLTWADIDLEAKTITLGARIAKKRARRIVEMSENLVEWLAPHAIRQTPLKGTNWRRDFDAVKRLAGYGGRAQQSPDDDAEALKPWTVDVMRHTAISHHFAMHQHEGKTASWAGNSPDMIHNHYKGLVRPSDAAAFWQLSPTSTKAKIVRLAA